jgi:hypothetical protein
MKHGVAQFITGINEMEAMVVVQMDQAAHGHC